MSLEKVKAIAQSLGYICKENEPMRSHTTFRIGGPAELFVECNDVNKIGEFLLAVKTYNVPMTVIGKGSNLLVSDAGIEGVVLYICDDKVIANGNTVIANAGAKLSSVCLAARDASLSGLEFAWGIPGSVGGAVYMNAGAYGGEIKQCITSCTSITLDGELITRSVNDMELDYRTSVYKKCDEIILSAAFKLIKCDTCEIQAKMDDYLGRRKDKQPLEYPSAGSTFKRPCGYFAGALIEQCGLKGYRVGDAAVSEKHAGFTVNLGNASCSDVLTLIENVKNKVKEVTGVTLEPEVIFKGR